MLNFKKNKIYSITEINQKIKKLLEKKIGKIWIIAEISNFVKPISGHWYFTLKDKNAQIRSVMFKYKNMKSNFKPKNGDEVLVNANISLYEAKGEYQLIISNIQSMGEGLLKKKFELLKQKLLEEGLFSQKYKKKIPKSIKCLGIITSKTGAALYDILKILKRRDPSLPIIIYPTIVQGENAIEKIIHSINLANFRKECDVLILARGGGSLEDLFVFNNEKIAYAIFSSSIPIISAIGHETDITISDFVADLRASTPSSAAELVSRDSKELENQIFEKKQKLEMAIDYYITKKLHLCSNLKYKIKQNNPNFIINQKQKKIIQKQQKIFSKIQQIIQKYNHKQHNIKQKLILNIPQKKLETGKTKLIKYKFHIKQIIKKILHQKKEKVNNYNFILNSTNPLSILSRGYSISKNIDNKIISRINQVKINEKIKIYIQDGIIESIVLSVKKN